MNNWHKKLTEAQLRGRRVRARIDMRNGHFAVSAGHLGTVRRKFKGIEVEWDSCGACGLRPIMTRIDASKLDLLSDAATATKASPGGEHETP